jgi:FkbM family methyltransferase
MLYFVFKRKQDKTEIALFKRIIRSGDTVIDIGANIGFYSIFFSETVGSDGKVISFEPDVKNFEKLSYNTKKITNVIIHNKAVASSTRQLKLYTSKELNVDHRTYQPDDYESEIEIEAVCLDDFLGNIPKIDVIKMDIQGFEMDAFRGMIGILKSNKDLKILSEFWPYGLSLAGSSSSAYIQFLNELHFKVYLLKNGQQIPLEIEEAKRMEILDKNQYFNVYAYRHV